MRANKNIAPVQIKNPAQGGVFKFALGGSRTHISSFGG